MILIPIVSRRIIDDAFRRSPDDGNFGEKSYRNLSEQFKQKSERLGRVRIIFSRMSSLF